MRIQARPVKPAELQRLCWTGTALNVIDVREARQFASIHLRGSVNVPEARPKALVWSLAHDRPNVLVDDDGKAVPLVAKALEFTGFPNIYYLEGGIHHWLEVGYPVVSCSGFSRCRARLSAALDFGRAAMGSLNAPVVGAALALAGVAVGLVLAFR